MPRNIRPVVLALLFLFLFRGQAVAQGTALTLGGGEELCLELPLQGGKTYEIRISLRTELEDVVVAMSLRCREANDRIVDYQTVFHDLGSEGKWQELFIEATVPAVDQNWELVVTPNRAGLFWWHGLGVRKVESKKGTAEYWDEKLATQGTFYTGLVIDARHLPLQRGMSPRIYSETGQLIYGGVLAPQDLLQYQGVVAYGSALTAELSSRLQLAEDYSYIHPLVIKAMAVVEPSRTGVYISTEDTTRILEAMAKYDFFARYAVIFLIN